MIPVEVTAARSRGEKAVKNAILLSVLSLFSLTSLAQAPEQGVTEEAAPQMAQMQARMQAMHALMEQIQTTDDPEERRRLMQEHMQSMHQGMMMMGEMMRGASGQGEGPGAGQGGRTRECRRNNTQCQMEEMQMQHGAMGQRMGMMQQMMQQMMEHLMQSEATQTPGDQPAEGAADHEAHH
jgi:hypothetical protein